jgi:hypothetical protein
VTLRLKNQSAFGDKFTFMPPMQIWPFAANRVVEYLIRRVDEARRRAR